MIFSNILTLSFFSHIYKQIYEYKYTHSSIYRILAILISENIRTNPHIIVPTQMANQSFPMTYSSTWSALSHKWSGLHTPLNPDMGRFHFFLSSNKLAHILELVPLSISLEGVHLIHYTNCTEFHINRKQPSSNLSTMRCRGIQNRQYFGTSTLWRPNHLCDRADHVDE